LKRPYPRRPAEDMGNDQPLRRGWLAVPMHFIGKRAG
jgi:hypothetical protein